MLKYRLIPVVLMKNGFVVQSKGFRRYQRLGDPYTIVRRLSDWGADELLYLDIGRQAVYDLGRDDLGAPNRHSQLEILAEISRHCFMPLTFGGGIRTLEDVRVRLRNGADKITLNTRALEDPEFITSCAREFGSQCVVVSLDAVARGPRSWEVCAGGRERTGREAAAWAAEAERLGAGEIFLNSIDRDGTGQGYDLPLIDSVVRAVRIPVIACGGVGQWKHLAEGIQSGGASAVAAANIFHYTENSVFEAKRFLFEAGLNVRPPELGIQA